jgi:predicted DNA-binding transcriptional regulator AlpA
MPEVLTTPEAASFLRLGKSSLEKMRVRGEGPTYLRLGSRRVAYLRSDLESWLGQRPKFANTSEHTSR